MNTLAALMAAHRLRRGLSQTEAAKQAGVSQQAWSTWEAGTRIPGRDHLPAIAKTLGLRVSDLRDVHPGEQHARQLLAVVDSARPDEDADPTATDDRLAQLETSLTELQTMLTALLEEVELLRMGGDDELEVGDPRV